MNVTLSLFAGAGAQFFDNNGNPLSGGKIYTYAAGTTTPLVTYTTGSSSAFHTNPIILDAAGRVPSGGEIWLNVGQGYKFVVKTSTEVLIATYDNIPSSAQPPAANDADSIMYEQGYVANAGSFVIGQAYRIVSAGTTDFTLIGSVSNISGTHFIATGAGTGTGTAEISQTVEYKLRQNLSVKDFGATGDGVTDDTAAIQLALTAGGGNAVYFPAGDYKLTSAVTIPNSTYVYGDGEGSRIFGDGTVGELLRGVWPCEYVTVDNLCLDGGKTNGTGPIVVCFYTSASGAQPTTYNKYITIRNCVIKNASAGIGVENGMYISAHHNTVQSMFYQLPGNPGAGVYGYGIVFNGCTRSSIEHNTIGVSGGLIERHAIYMPVFRDGDVATFTNFCAEMRVIGNTCQVNPDIDPFSSCIESWSFFDCLIADNILIGGQRGIDSTPEYKNGGRVMIVNNIIKDSTICIRNDRAIYGAAPNTYYFEEWLIDGNQIMPLTSTAGVQGVSIQGVKKVTFTNNYVRHTGASSFAFGYYGPVNNIEADAILSANNTIEGFLQGFYLANVVKFYDDSTVFRLFTGGVLPYVQVSNVQSKEMHPVVAPYTELWDLTDAPLNGNNWHGVQYFSQAVGKNIICTYDGVSVTYWVDEAGFQVRGTTASRPNLKGPSGAEATGMAIALPYGFEFYDTNVGATIYWNGNSWFTGQQPAVPVSGTTTQLNDFKTNYPNALNAYNAMSWNTTTSKPVFWNELTGNWVYADGTAI